MFISAVNNYCYNPAPRPVQPQGNSYIGSAVKYIFLGSLGSPGMTGCSTFVPDRPVDQDAGSGDAAGDANNNNDATTDCLCSDAIQSDVYQGDVIQSDAIQSDVIQSDVLQSDGQTDSIQSDVLQTDAQVDGPHCGVFFETDAWSGVQTNLDPMTISGSLILSPFQTSGSYLKIWDLGSSNNNIGSGATLTFNANIPAGTSLTAETCTNGDGSSCTSWQGLVAGDGGANDKINSLPNSYLHVKFTFSSTSTSLTPQLNDYSVNYCVN